MSCVDWAAVCCQKKNFQISKVSLSALLSKTLRVYSSHDVHHLSLGHGRNFLFVSRLYFASVFMKDLENGIQTIHYRSLGYAVDRVKTCPFS